MTNINAVFMSVNLYSSTLDNLVIKTDEVVDKLVDVCLYTSIAVDDMKEASESVETAVDKMLKASFKADEVAEKLGEIGLSTDKMIDKMLEAGNATNKVTEKMIEAGTSTQKMTDQLLDASKISGEAADKLSGVGDEIDELNNKLDSSKESSEKASSGIGELVGSIFSLDNIQKGMSLIDNFTGVNTKLGLVNDSFETQSELQDRIFAAANRSRGAYEEMAGTFTKLESSTGDLFKDNNETITFTELVQKSFVAGGGSQEERSASMSQFTDSVTSGGLQSEDLTALSQSAPGILEAISNYTNKSGDELMALAAEGGLTADVIKNAMFAASSDINSSFENAPMTFADIWSRIKNGGLQAFSGIMEKITELISTKEFQQFIDGLITGFSFIANVVTFLFDKLINGWSTVGPILAIIGGVILAGIIANLWAMIPPLIIQALPILVIIGLIVLVMSVVQKLGVSWEEIFGFIGGVIGVFIAFFYNVFVGIWNFVAEFINFFGNVFNDPIASIQLLFFNLMITVLGFIEGIAKGIEELLNKIPGVDITITSKITDLKNDLTAKAATLQNDKELKEFVKTKGYTDYNTAYDNGNNKGLDMFNGLEKTLNTDNNAVNEIPKGLDELTDKSNPMPVEGTGANGSVDVSMPDDDLKYMKEIAERDYVANIASHSLAPNISIKFGDVRETADANKVAGRIKKILQEEIAIASEGVY
ncbi:MAG: phage tape measure protein [Anaerocolumna sp.]|jgi:tape measure domain-containing protein|nr:phage tape measure protein [Anaerocolumna sp.]